MLKDFSVQNSVGFRKIIKKHDKGTKFHYCRTFLIFCNIVPGLPTLRYFLEDVVYKSYFHTSNVVTNMMNEIEVCGL